MEKLKEINVILDGIYKTLSYNLSPSGKVKLESTTAARLFTEIAEAKKVIAELEKIDNYTNASTVPAKKEEPYKEMVSLLTTTKAKSWSVLKLCLMSLARRRCLLSVN